jgi:hypothetical protein
MCSRIIAVPVKDEDGIEDTKGGRKEETEWGEGRGRIWKRLGRDE